MLSDAACAHEHKTKFNPVSITAIKNVSRAQAATSSNYPTVACELDHDWTAPSYRKGVEKPVANWNLPCMFFWRGSEIVRLVPIVRANEIE